MRKQVYEFHEGGLSDVSLLGNKGANLCEMCRLKIPVPPGFILTTEACVEYFHHLKEQRENRADLKEGVAQMLPAHLVDEYTKAVHDLEQRTGRTFGLAKDKAHAHDCPLLLAVRSGAAVSMPGMMDSVLNLGLNDEIIDKLARSTENIHFALDTYRRFLQMFGCVVLGVPKVEFDNILNNVKSRTGHLMDSQLEVVDLQEVITAYKAIAIVPSDPWEQLELTIAAVFNSWNNPRAVSYRDINGISNCAGTAVTIQSMVFGNMNYKSGTGVCFTRHPSTGENVFFGEYLCNAEGEELVAGCRSPHGLEYLKKTQPAVFESLSIIQKQLEFSYRDMQDIEFTVENGELFVLQTRTGKRTAQASVRIAVEMAEERLITQREALLRVDANQMDFFQHPTIDPAIAATGLCGLGNLKIGRGLPASSGASTGAIVFSSESALQWSREGRAVILCRVETSADDIVGFKACEGILTMKGGMTSHAAVVARGMGKSAVTGAGMCVTSLSNCYMHIDPELEILTCADGTMLRKGEIITIDGSQGDVYKGAVPTVPAGHDANYKVLLGWADRYKRLQVFANAETEDDVRMAVTCGAEGIGLCRTEHMFFKSDRIDLFRKMILSTSSLERNECLQSIMPMNRGDILSIFRLMKNRQVTVRLLDPPLHEFLPSTNTASFVRDVTDLALRIGMDPVVCLARVRELQESNPMLGFRGCRLSVVYPEITTMQVKAILGILEEMARIPSFTISYHLLYLNLPYSFKSFPSLSLLNSSSQELLALRMLKDFS